ncbi:MAG TPA: tyrosine-type recombinase/integrase [Pyrinomonadaceae bacterium]|nr:tyrosine-type recombinase/integrase [Pyrinomonadaceae bacterium]
MDGDRKRRTRGQVIPLEGNRRTCRAWGIRVPLKERGRNGRHATHYETFSGTELRATKRRDDLLAQVEAGLLFRPAPLTVSALVAEWLEQKRREGKRTASLYAYKDAAEFYIKPALGSLRLKELTPLRVREMLNGLQDRGLATGTINYARTILKMILRDAVSWGHLKENPATNVKAPKGAEGRVAYAMTPEEARTLVEAALAEPDDLVFVFALLTGLRPEEYLGLPRDHVELVKQGEQKRGLVRVRQVAVKVRGGGWEFPPPKTKQGVRDVPFPAWLYREIERYGALVESRRLATGAGWTDYGLVFPSPTGEPQQRDGLRDRRFKRLLKRAELPAHFTLYSLRYTFATLQYLAGERDRVISDLMGHTRTDFTKEVYVKAIPIMREWASDSLERLIFEGVRTTLAQSGGERVM